MSVSDSTSDGLLGTSHSIEGEDDSGETAPWKKRARARLHRDVEPQEVQRCPPSENSEASVHKSNDNAWTPRLTLAAGDERPFKSKERSAHDQAATQSDLFAEVAQSVAAATENSQTAVANDMEETSDSQQAMSTEIAQRLAAARANSTVEAYLKELRWRADGFQRLSAAITWHPEAWDIFAMVLRWFPKRDEILASALSERPGDYGSWAKDLQSQESQASVADTSVAQAVAGSPVVTEDTWDMPAGLEENQSVPAENAICLSSDEEGEQGQPTVTETPQADNSSSGELHCFLNVDTEFGHTPAMASISLGNADGLKCNWYEEAALIFKATPECNDKSSGGASNSQEESPLENFGSCLDDLLQASQQGSGREREIWTQCLDARSGRVYYYNGQDTRWERPVGANVYIKTASGTLESPTPLNISDIYNIADQSKQQKASRSDQILRMPVSHVKGVHIAPDGQQIILIFMPSLEFFVQSTKTRVQIPTLSLTFRSDDASEAAETLLRWLPHAEIEDYASGRDLSTSAAPPILRLGRLQVRSRDLLFMNDGDFLNDTILDFTLRLGLELVAPTDLQESIYLASTFFFKQLTAHGAESGEKGWENVRTWTRHLSGGLMSRECILVPMNANEVHWWLAVVCRPSGKCLKGSQRIVCLDSSPYPFTERARIRILKGYLNREWKERGGGESPAEPLKAVMASQAKQKNLVDCGVFSIEYMVYLFRNPDVLARLGTKRERLWFSQRRVSHRRRRLRWMISRLAAAGHERKEVDVHNLLKDEALRRLVLEAFLDDPPPPKKTLGSKSRRKLARKLAKLKKVSKHTKTRPAPQSQPTSSADEKLGHTFDSEQVHPPAETKETCDEGFPSQKREHANESFEVKRPRVLPPPRGKAQSKIISAPASVGAVPVTSHASDSHSAVWYPPVSTAAAAEVNNATKDQGEIGSSSSSLTSANRSLTTPASTIVSEDVPASADSMGQECEHSSRDLANSSPTAEAGTPISSSSAPPPDIAAPSTDARQNAEPGVNLNVMLRKNIEIMARQVVKMGKSFEEMVLKMNAGKPQFSFLYGGEGADYYSYMLSEARGQGNLS